jgi:hypothetical protein
MFFSQSHCHCQLYVLHCVCSGRQETAHSSDWSAHSSRRRNDQQSHESGDDDAEGSA